MSAKPKQKLRERQARKRNLEQKHQSTMSWATLDIPREVDYIVNRAAKLEARCVAAGSLVFFSTETGDAWMLDLEDQYAMCLARDGERQPIHIFDIDGRMAVEWDRDFLIEGNCLKTVERKTGRITAIEGYPIEDILATAQMAKKPND